jgi:outer membrane protein assembly factor BamB
MIRQRATAIALPLLFYACVSVSAAGAADLIPQGTAAAHGLTRMWSVQMEIDHARSSVQSVLLDRGVLFVQTTAAMLHAFDAETGRPIWNAPRQVGNPRQPSMTPAVNRRFVAVLNGTRLYVLNRVNGDLLWETELDGIPGNAPSLVDDRVVVPMLNGLIVAYRLKPVEKQELKPKSKSQVAVEDTTPPEALKLVQGRSTPLTCQSSGEVTAPPLFLSASDEEDLVAWPTSTGSLLIAGIPRVGNQFIVRHRVLVGNGTAAGLAYRPAEGKSATDAGLVYVVSREGFVHAVNERTGQSTWEFPVAEAVIEAPVMVAGNVYVATQLGGMFCLDAKTGLQRWAAPQVIRFVAAGPDRVYAVDKLQRLVVLDTRSGSRLDSLDVHAFPFRLANAQTDRLYLASEKGLVQCLRDLRQVEPLVYQTEQKRGDKKVEKEKPVIKKTVTEHKPKAAAEGMAVEETEKPAKKAHKAREPKEPKEPKEKPAKKSKKGKKDEGGGANPFAAKPKKE